MRYKIVLPTLFLSLGLISFNKMQASTVNKPNSGKKNGTTILNESKKTDEEIKKQIETLLDEMSLFKNEENNSAELSELILSAAFDYEGVRYRFGGSTRNGLDCSGLVTKAFNDASSISLPRSSADMAKVGDKISKDEAQRGDLIFFRTGKGNRISHVGIITEVLDDEIKFIHSSTTKGVIVSTTKEDYYKKRFAQINRVLLDNAI